MKVENNDVVFNNNDNNDNNDNQSPAFNNTCDFNLLPFSNDWPSSSGGGFALDVIIVSPERQGDHGNSAGYSNGKNNRSSNDDEEGVGEVGITASSDFFVEFPNFQRGQKEKLKQQQRQLQQQQQNQRHQKTGASREQNDHNGVVVEEGGKDEDGEEEHIVLIQINNNMIDPLLLSMSLQPKQKAIVNPMTNANTPNNVNADSSAPSSSSPSPSRSPSKIKTPKNQQFVFDHGKSTKPSTQVLTSLVQQEVIKPGRNVIQYILASYTKPKTKPKSSPNKASKEGDEERKTTKSTTPRISYKPLSTATAFIYSWAVNDKVIVVDIDGTVTKSDVRGVVSSIITEKYEHVHSGVCAFFSNLVKQYNNNSSSSSSSSSSSGEIRVMYLSSRSIRLMNSTRKFLAQLSQSPDSSIDTNISTVLEYMSCIKPSSVQVDIVEQDEKEYDFCKENKAEGMVRSPIHSDSLGELQFDNDNRAAEANSENAEIYNHKKEPESFEILEKAARLPQGPIFLHTGSISTVLVMEIIKKSAHKYKSDTLTRQVVLPFLAAGKKKMEKNNSENDGGRKKKNSSGYDSLGIFLAGFGNKHTDAMAYEMAGLLPQDIYIINKKSELITTDHDGDAAVRDEKLSRDSPTNMIDSNDSGVEVGCFGSKYKPNEDEVIRKDSSSSTNNITTVYRPKESNELTKKLTFSGYDDPQLLGSVLNKIS